MDESEEDSSDVVPLAPHYHNYRLNSAKPTVDSIFNKFGQRAHQTNPRSLREQAIRHNVPEGTVLSWWGHWKRNPQWKPTQKRQRKPRIFTSEQERLFLEQLRSKFIRRKRLLTKPQLICEARSFWNTLGIDQRISGDTKFSPHWATNFMKRNGLSLRKTRLAKRPGNANTEIVKHFRETLSVCISHYGPENVLNFDETSWRLVGPFIHGTG